MVDWLNNVPFLLQMLLSFLATVLLIEGLCHIAMGNSIVLALEHPNEVTSNGQPLQGNITRQLEFRNPVIG